MKAWHYILIICGLLLGGGGGYWYLFHKKEDEEAEAARDPVAIAQQSLAAKQAAVAEASAVGLSTPAKVSTPLSSTQIETASQLPRTQPVLDFDLKLNAVCPAGTTCPYQPEAKILQERLNARVAILNHADEVMDLSASDAQQSAWLGITPAMVKRLREIRSSDRVYLRFDANGRLRPLAETGRMDRATEDLAYIVAGQREVSLNMISVYKMTTTTANLASQGESARGLVGVKNLVVQI